MFIETARKTIDEHVRSIPLQTMVRQWLWLSRGVQAP